MIVIDLVDAAVQVLPVIGATLRRQFAFAAPIEPPVGRMIASGFAASADSLLYSGPRTRNVGGDGNCSRPAALDR